MNMNIRNIVTLKRPGKDLTSVFTKRFILGNVLIDFIGLSNLRLRRALRFTTSAVELERENPNSMILKFKP